MLQVPLPGTGPSPPHPLRGPPKGFAAPAQSCVWSTRRVCLSTWRGCLSSTRLRPRLAHRRTKAPKEKGLFGSPKATLCPHLSGLPPLSGNSYFFQAPPKRGGEPEHPPVGGHSHSFPPPPPTHPPGTANHVVGRACGAMARKTVTPPSPPRNRGPLGKTLQPGPRGLGAQETRPQAPPTAPQVPAAGLGRGALG